MSKPTPKQNFLQTALIMLTIFLGINLLMPKDKPNTQTLGQIYALMVQENRQLQDISRTVNTPRSFRNWKRKARSLPQLPSRSARKPPFSLRIRAKFDSPTKPCFLFRSDFWIRRAGTPPFL